MGRKISLRANKIFLLVLLCLYCSCDGVLFHDFRTVAVDGWGRCDTLEYVYEKGFVKDTAVLLSVDVRTVASYPYKDIVVAVEALDTAGGVFCKDTFVCAVYDDNGRRVGHTAGIIYQQSSESMAISLPYQTNLLRLSHLMPDSLLCGIFDVGIKICSEN